MKGWAYADYAPPMPRLKVDMSRWPVILANNNFRAIINGGLTLGSLVLDGHDQRASNWKEMAFESIGLFNALLKDDGSYDEAVNYLNYAMTYQLHAMEAARRMSGIDFFDSANFQGMMDYVLAMYLPDDLYGHGSLTFGDAGNTLRSSKAFWVARNARDGLAQYIALNYSDHDLLSLLYYDASVQPTPPEENAHFVELDLDWIISRNGYEPDDFVVGMRSGAPMNHEHGDRNSIQMKAFREILLADHRRLTYFAMDPEWEMRGTGGHNAVLIDGVGHQYHEGEEGTNESKSYARIVRSGERDGYHFWASDATSAYKLVHKDVRSVTRTVISFPDVPAVVVLDKIIKQSQPSIFASRWHAENADGQAAIKFSDQSFVIARPQARLHATVASNVPQSVAVGEFVSANKDHPYKFVEVESSQQALQSLSVMVAIAVRSGEPDPTIEIVQGSGEWTIDMQRNDKSTLLRISDSGELPEFEVLRK
ncbi:MAG: hypothetical protein HKN13_05295 [Rhodothermales bacterium]|nr:hypothetical protein [Rhodothermales bacterium]